MPRIVPALSQTEPAYSIKEAAKFVGVPLDIICDFTRMRNLKAYRIGSRLFYLQSDLRVLADAVAILNKESQRP